MIDFYVIDWKKKHKKCRLCKTTSTEDNKVAYMAKLKYAVLLPKRYFPICGNCLTDIQKRSLI